MKFKSITARELFKRERWLKEELWGGRFWIQGITWGRLGREGIGHWKFSASNTVVENKFK